MAARWGIGALCSCLLLALVFFVAEKRSFAGLPEEARSGGLNNTATLRESLGFFDYPNGFWERQKRIIAKQSRLNRMSSRNVGKVFFQENWEPVLSCPFEERLGKWGDGGKWICNPETIRNQESCLVYSVGSNGQYDFEESMHELNKACEIHTFDHTLSPSKIQKKPDFVTLHLVGLGAEDSKDGKIKSLPSIQKMLGHEERRIDILKIDCEGCEYEVMSAITSPGTVRQVLIEIHFKSGPDAAAATHALFEQATKDGYVVFHKEPNTLGCGGNCIEYGFIHLSLP